MAYEFQKNDYVIYGKTGLCMIKDIRTLTFSNVKENEYYILQPIRDRNATIFVPCNSSALISKIRRILTKDEIDDVLLSAKSKKINWIEDKNERSEYFRQTISKGNQSDIISLINCIYQKKKDRAACGKKLWSYDEQVLNSLEKLIEEEFSYSLHLGGEQLGEYIRNKLDISSSEAQ